MAIKEHGGVIAGARESKMKRSEQRIKNHIISMRISSEEWASLHETMKCLELQRVSDLMREAFKLVMTPASSFEPTTTESQHRAG
jgi:hypothetical protein